MPYHYTNKIKKREILKEDGMYVAGSPKHGVKKSPIGRQNKTHFRNL